MRSRARVVLFELGLVRSELSVSLVGDVEMRRLNRTYRRRDRPTDVLAVAFEEDRLPPTAPARRLLGDIVISIETAARRAPRRQIAAELERLAVHGLCHLFGHDHKRPPEARRMFRLERRLRRLPLPGSFRLPSRPARA